MPTVVSTNEPIDSTLPSRTKGIVGLVEDPVSKLISHSLKIGHWRQYPDGTRHGYKKSLAKLPPSGDDLTYPPAASLWQ